ncbi:MAG TPA: FAD-binding oxidoreductase [Kofleriaceae bacterium]|nr:FAD-binding oxidoreductase [Kofleriaceae bacterium]
MGLAGPRPTGARGRVAAIDATSPLPARAEVAIIGAGVMGLSIAYNLAARGLTDVVVFERGYLAEGASGRNGGGVRQQWSTAHNVRLMQESVELCRSFAVELGVNVWFRQGGYLFLARSAPEVARLERNAALQARLGLPTRMLDQDGARQIVPELDPTGILAASFNPSDGILFPWPFLWGYAQRAADMGVKIYTFTGVRSIEREADGGFAVASTAGTVRARRVVAAAGAWSPEVARMVGVELPTYPIRHEICSSEPLKPFLGPMVSELNSGLYFSQSMRGEIVGGVSLPPEVTYSTRSTLRFLTTYARRLCAVVPRLGDVKVLRQWAGAYDMSPDGNPILGCAPEAAEFYLCCGFVGHGFMMAPAVGKHYAEWLTGGARHEIFDRFRIDRLRGGGGAPVGEREDFNIG